MKKILTLLITTLIFAALAGVCSHAADYSAYEKNWLSAGDVFNLHTKAGTGCSLYAGIDEEGAYRCISCTGKAPYAWFPTAACASG